MNHNEFAKYFNFCNSTLQVKIYPVTARAFDCVNIVVNKNGIEKKGHIDYLQKPKQADVKYWQVIENLYKEYFEVNSKSNIKIHGQTN